MTDSKHFKSIIERIEELHGRDAELTQEMFEIQREISQFTGGTKHTYIFEADGLGLVKIGRAHDVQKRLLRLQKGSPVGLRMIRLFTFDCEQLLHRHYADLRQHGEWFKFCPTMRSVFEPRPKSNIHRALAVPEASQETASAETGSATVVTTGNLDALSPTVSPGSPDACSTDAARKEYQAHMEDFRRTPDRVFEDADRLRAQKASSTDPEWLEREAERAARGDQPSSFGSSVSSSGPAFSGDQLLPTSTCAEIAPVGDGLEIPPRLRRTVPA